MAGLDTWVLYLTGKRFVDRRFRVFGSPENWVPPGALPYAFQKTRTVRTKTHTRVGSLTRNAKFLRGRSGGKKMRKSRDVCAICRRRKTRAQKRNGFCVPKREYRLKKKKKKPKASKITVCDLCARVLIFIVYMHYYARAFFVLNRGGGYATTTTTRLGQ